MDASRATSRRRDDGMPHPGADGGVSGPGSSRSREVGARLDALRDVLERRRVPAVLLSARKNFTWLTAGGDSAIVLSSDVGAASLLVMRDEVVVITQNIEAARLAEEELAGLGIETVAVPWWETDGTAAEVRRRAGGGAVSEDTLEDELVPLRSVLSAFDRERLGEVGRAAEKAAGDALDGVRPGMTEGELVTEVLGRLTGLHAPVILVAADDRIARYRHPVPTDTPILARVMLVLVAEKWGLHAALTRFRELEPVPADLDRRRAAVAEVEKEMHAATRPGSTLGDVFAAGQAAYRRVGFPEEWRLHHQGGTIAYQGRETIATPGDPTAIRAGMAFAWNPSITGTKAEDTFVLGDDGMRSRITGANGASRSRAEGTGQSSRRS